MKINNRLTKIIILIIIVLGIIVGAYYLVKINTNNQSNDNGDTKTVINYFKMKQDFAFEIPEGWTKGFYSQEEINTVKFAAPADYLLLEPIDRQDEYGGPSITVQTFTIDKNLSARDVVNLIHDQKIADQIDSGDEQCLSKINEYNLNTLDVYAYKDDTTNVEICTRDITEPGIVEVLIAKGLNNNRVFMATFGAANVIDYQNYKKDFKKIIFSIE